MQVAREHWTIPPDACYLNHGSFGPSPRVVQQARAEWTARLESQPMDFFLRRLDTALAEARERLGRFVGASGNDLIHVENATAGMNIVAASVDLAPGDEVLLNDHEYGAVIRIWERACRRSGASVRVAPLPVPLETQDQLVDALFSHATPRTRVVVVSHITSPTAIIFPVEQICRRAREMGLVACIDGPHAVAMRDIRLAELDCDFYTASCHKWLSAPFGSGFLYVHPRRQASLIPIQTSWGRPLAGETPPWRAEFVWSGTRDPAAYLATTAAIEFMEAAGLAQFREHGGSLARYARQSIERLTGLGGLTPDDALWYGTMVSTPLPPGDAPGLQKALWERYRIEVPIVDWNGRRFVRPSCHWYTSADDIDRLTGALATLLNAGM